MLRHRNISRNTHRTKKMLRIKIFFSKSENLFKFSKINFICLPRTAVKLMKMQKRAPVIIVIFFGMK